MSMAGDPQLCDGLKETLEPECQAESHSKSADGAREYDHTRIIMTWQSQLDQSSTEVIVNRRVSNSSFE